MKTIDIPGLAKISSGNLLRDLTNDLGRVRRRLKRAAQKHKGLQALKETLQPYLQPGDYEHLLEQLKREVKRLQDEDMGLSQRVRDERLRQALGDERFEKLLRERDEIDRKIFRGQAKNSTD